ncbi:MAG: polysaccharide deacetylase family protein [Candidatus Omnitrophota bacterium]
MNALKEKLSVIIATKDRPEQARRLLKNIESQEALPEQVIIADGGTEAVHFLAAEFPRLRVDYVRSIPPSLTRQRNDGIRAVAREATIVAFFDDDIVLEDGCLKSMMRFWESADTNTVGAACNITNQRYRHPGVLEKIFLVDADRSGRILRSGFQSKVCFQDETVRVDWLAGCSMVWRKSVFEECMFDEWFSGYARYEEVDFSYRAGKERSLYIVAGARIMHLKKDLEDLAFSFKLGKMQIVNRMYLVAKNQGLSIALCCWASFGLFLNNAVKGIIRRDQRYLLRAQGNIAGFCVCGAAFLRRMKKRAVILFSDTVACVVFTVRKIMPLNAAGRGKNGSLRILVYHSVPPAGSPRDPGEGNVPLDMFAEQMRILKGSSRAIVSLAEGVAGLRDNSLPRGAVAVTFDDGMANAYTGALEVLDEHGIPATFFVVYKHAEERAAGYMNWEMVASLRDKGYGVGSHSYSHDRLSALDDERHDAEIVNTKKMFNERGIPVDYFAYPFGFYGDYSKRSVEFVKKAGYAASFNDIMGENRPGDDLYELRRTRVSWRDNAFRFRMKIDGAYDWVDAVKRMNSGLWNALRTVKGKA